MSYEYSAAKYFMRKVIKEERDTLRPLYLNRLRKIIESKPRGVTFITAVEILRNDKKLEPDTSIFDAIPTDKQNSNPYFLQNCFSIFGKKRMLDAVIEEHDELQRMLS